MSTQSPKRWKRRSKMVTKADPLMTDSLPTDIIIPIMGPTGSGKSTLINMLAGKPVVAVGNQLQSCTAQLQPVVIEAARKAKFSAFPTVGRLILVDTPGFDDTYVEDSEILRRISVWMAASYSDSMKLAGVIFLHEISQVRMRGTAKRNTDVFKKLCGDQIMKKVVLGTTMWEEVPTDLANARQEQLKAIFWTDMIDNNAQVMQIRREEHSAWAAVNAILNGNEGLNEVMRIQKELVDLQRMLPDTDAGKSLRTSLELELEQQKARMKQLMASARADRNQERVKQLEDIKKTLGQISQLNVTISRRILNFFGA